MDVLIWFQVQSWSQGQISSKYKSYHYDHETSPTVKCKSAARGRVINAPRSSLNYQIQVSLIVPSPRRRLCPTCTLPFDSILEPGCIFPLTCTVMHAIIRLVPSRKRWSTNSPRTMFSQRICCTCDVSLYSLCGVVSRLFGDLGSFTLLLVCILMKCHKFVLSFNAVSLCSRKQT